ncbi:hypothetical protein C8T65DRAFT_673682 [Cerioporus squamosus]|nr:hypothetical protein C8T65DRAFT_673682 [Cerioporus squamosus]
MLYVILNTITSSPKLSAESCNLIVKAGLTVDNLQYIAPAFFAGLRAFALTKNRVASLLIFLLSLAPFAVNLFQYHLGISGVLIPGAGCGETYSITEAEVIILTAVSRAGSIISDFLLVMATWRNLRTSPILAELSRGTRASLASVMLWNGSLYFIILFVLNVLHLGFTLSSVRCACLPPSRWDTSS